MISKVFGWLLLILGIAVIVWTLYFSYAVFTGKSEAPIIFSQTQNTALDKTGINQLLEDQLKSILPSGSVVKLLNLAVWSMLAFLLMFGGGQISGLGIKLIK